METTSGKETITVLRRLIAYAEKIFQLSKDIVTQVSDRREKPRISTAAVVKSSLVLFWARLGSINSWEQVGRARFWQRWLEEPTFSADTLGRVHALLDAKGLRQGLHDVYERLKRNKALPDIYDLRSEEHTSELQSPCNLVCRLLLEKKKTSPTQTITTSDSPLATPHSSTGTQPHNRLDICQIDHLTPTISFRL